MDDVRVHRNSSAPARVGALAFARGSDIHLGPGEERHLPHEAWHVVQQKHGRVRPTQHVFGVPINDDPKLEREADAQGGRAPSLDRARFDGISQPSRNRADRPTVQRRKVITTDGPINTEDKTKAELIDIMDWSDDETLVEDIRSAIEKGEFRSSSVEASSGSSSRNAPVRLDVARSREPLHQSTDIARSRVDLSSIHAFDRSSLRRADRGEESVDFSGPTVGVEQEIVKTYKLKCLEKNRGVIGDVVQSGAILLYFTTDMGSDGEYTIELKTTPCVKNDQAALKQRSNAMKVMIGAIKQAGDAHGPVLPRKVGALELKIRMPHHTIDKDGDGFAYGNQATMGFNTNDIGSEAIRKALFLDRDSSWYIERYQSDLGDDIASASLRGLYAMIASVIANVARIIKKTGQVPDNEDGVAVPLADPKVKNSWDTLPRTPPWEWLDALDQSDRHLVEQTLEGRFSRDPVEKAAFKYIKTKQSLGGHPIPRFTIMGRHAAAFEIRQPPESLNDFFYSEGDD